MALNLNNLAEAAKKTATGDMTQATKGSVEPPAAGMGTAVLVGYIEVGKHTRKIKGVDKTTDECILRFELTGPLWPAREVDGVKIPHIIDEKVTRSLNDKAKLFKLFTRMNYEGKSTHITDMLGKTFKVRVVHRKAVVSGKDMVFAELHDADGFTVYPPRLEIVDEDTGAVQVKSMKINPHISELHALLWDAPDMEQWKSIFIEGEWPASEGSEGSAARPARSKNKYQLLVGAAKNYEGSAVHQLLAGAGIQLDIPAPGEDFVEDAEQEEAPTSAVAGGVDAVKGDDALSDVGA